MISVSDKTNTGQISSNSSRFNIQVCPRRVSVVTHPTMLDIVELVVSTIMDEYKEFVKLDTGADGFEYRDIFHYIRHEGSIYVSVYENSDEVYIRYVNMLNSISFWEILLAANEIICSDLYESLISSCNIHKGKFIEYCYKLSHTPKKTLCTYKDEGLKMPLPEWVVDLANEKIFDLIELPFKDILTITNENIIRGVNGIMRSCGLNKITSKIFTITKVESTDVEGIRIANVSSTHF